MGASDLKPHGYPTAQVIQDFEFMMYCGGKGGGSMAQYMNTTRVIFKVKNNRFTVRNRLLLLFNEVFEVYQDAGAAPLGGRIAGPRLPMWWAAVADPDAITDQQVIDRGDMTDAELPYYVTLDESDLPQPIDPAFDGNTYVVIVWKDPSAVGYAYGLTNEDGDPTANLIVVDYQQDIKI